MFENKKILILGFGRSGSAAASFLIERKNKVILNDSSPEEKHDEEKIKELREKGVEFIFGTSPDNLLDESFDYLIKNPGVPIDHPYVLKAHELNIEVINEVEMSYRLLPENITLIGITGTNGKTTTTTLTYEIIKNAYPERTKLIGNIGIPFCSILNDIKENDILVMEVSCQQLENLKEFTPHIGVLTNVSPAHIDFMKTYDHYKELKARMFKNQTEEDIAITNIENEEATNISKNFKAQTKYFSSHHEISGCYEKDNFICYYGEKIINLDDIKIPGKHNLENIMASIMVAKELDIPNEKIVEVISNFKGVEHRLEYVDTINGVDFYNDTEATNIKCTQIALASFKRPTIVILGGLERGQTLEDLTPFMKNVKAIIAIGECRKRILKYGRSINKETYDYEFLREGFKKCIELSKPKDIVLLSPATASWDQYKECEERGKEFKDLVKEIKNED